MTTLPRMSHSRWETFNECGERYRRKYDNKEAETPNVWGCVGTAFHTMCDWRDDRHGPNYRATWGECVDNYIDIAIAKSGFPLERWDNPMHKPAANGEQLGKLKYKLGPEWLEMYNTWRDTTGWVVADNLPPDRNGNTYGIEYAIEFQIGDVVTIIIVDRIFQKPDGMLVCVDLKTWSKRKQTPQLPTYLVGLRASGVPVVEAMYYEARKGETTKPVRYEHWDVNRLAALHEQTAYQIAAGYRPPKPGPACDMCGFRRNCVFTLQ